MKPEEEARKRIDDLLTSAGWIVQDFRDLDLSIGMGVAVREFPLKSGGPGRPPSADYLLFVDRMAAGILEAKPAGTTLSGVAEQSSKYTGLIPENIPRVQDPPPFNYESSGVETFFRDLRDPAPRSRRIFAFHKPETLKEWLGQGSTLRDRLRSMPPVQPEGLWDCQLLAVRNLEKSFAEARPRALIQMASGSGKTFTAVNFVYRLIKYAGAKRVLFLVDRSNLARQTKVEFEKFATPDDGRKFTELYNVQRLTSNSIDPVNKVVITTIQRLYSILKGEAEFDPSLEEVSMFELQNSQENKEVSYNQRIPIETFDFIVTDECHRSIYNLWRQVLEYFDAFLIGLTATPSKQTIGFFDQNLVMEYTYENAVADGVNVAYEVYKIMTEITQHGSKVEAGFYVDKRDKLTRKIRWELLDQDLPYTERELDRSVVAKDQIRTVMKTFKDKLSTELFPGRKEVPKTLIFAKDDSHAEDIVQIVREEFGKGNEFCKKITYRTTGEDPEDLITSFRNSYYPRIAVTVDMISTGTDIKPLECLLFMRDVRSRVFFEQMKGRGARIISPTDLNAVTPDSKFKTHFVIVDTVGVCESDKTDSRPLERKRSVPFDKLLMGIALGNRDVDAVTSLAGRLARMERELTETDVAAIKEVAGRSVREMVNDLLGSVDEDKRIELAKKMFDSESPTREQIAEAGSKLLTESCSLFDKPKVRDTLIEINVRNEQTIDTISKDKVLFAGYDQQAKERAQTVVETFKKFIADNKDELTALQVIYSKPFGQRRLTYDAIKQLAAEIEKPPYKLTPELLWQAYEQLDKSKVKGAVPQRLLTNIISLIRFAVGEYEILEPFADTINRRFEVWLTSQEKNGATFTTEQKQWLSMIKDQVAASLGVGADDFQFAPFFERGGLLKFRQLFGPQSEGVLDQMNRVLVQ